MAEATSSSIVIDASSQEIMDVIADLETYPEWTGDQHVRWWLIEGQILTAMDGTYQLTDLGGGSTQVDYFLSLDVKIPMIGMLRRKAEKVITDTALKELKRRVEA